MPVEIQWSPLARASLAEIHAYVSLDQPAASERLATRIVALIEALNTRPRLGRAGIERGIRELVVGGTPYIIVYRVWQSKVTIKMSWHGN